MADLPGAGVSPAVMEDRMNKKWVVRLEAEERDRLRQMVRAGRTAAYKVRHANTLLAVDESEGGAGLGDAEASAALGVSVRAIEGLRRRFVTEGLEACLGRKRQVRPSVERKFDGDKEARLIAVACGAAPQGRERWTLRLLADRMVELRIVERCSRETVRRTLKKTS